MNICRHSARGSTGTSMSARSIGLSNVCFSFTSTTANLRLLRRQHLLAVERHLEPVGIVEDRFLLALLEIEDRRPGSSRRACRRAAARR